MQPQSANYFCTWHLMYWFPDNGGVPDLQTRDVLCDELLFGENGIAARHYPQARKDLYLLLDDGWDVRGSQNSALPEDVWFRPYIGSCELSEEKFPGYGSTPPERLKTLVGKVKNLGWKGLGIWISPTVSGAPEVEGSGGSFASFWRTRMEWSKYAGVSYWKVDWGDYDMSDKHRRLLSALKEEIYPELIMEHACNRSAYNKRGEEDRFSLAVQRHRLAYSDVLRLYDVAFALSIPTTLSRAAALLTHPVRIKPGCLGLINAEDEVYLAAALGLAFGVMRFDIGDAPINSGPNWAFGGEGRFPATRPARRQHNEVLRAVRWQSEYAPAFRADLGNTTVSHEIGEDNWCFSEDETWEKALCKDEATAQRAPLVIARNVAMPVETEYDSPYLVACRNPNGSLSIAALGRVRAERGYFASKADVYWNIGANSGAIGIFGYYRSLTLHFHESLEGKRIFAKDLLREEFIDVTKQVKLHGKKMNKITLDGVWMESRCKNRPGDFSEPGFVIQIGERGDFIQVETPPANIKRPAFDWLCIAQLNIAAACKGFALKLYKRKKHRGFVR